MQSPVNLVLSLTVAETVHRYDGYSGHQTQAITYLQHKHAEHTHSYLFLSENSTPWRKSQFFQKK